MSMCSIGKTRILSMRINTPLGFYVVEACGVGVHSVHRENSRSTIGPAPDPDFSIDVLKTNPIVVTEAVQAVDGKDPVVTLKKAVEWFHLYFTNLKEQEAVFPISLKICVPSATDLQIIIWEALQRVGYGKTISYGGLAKLVNRPNAARAVGSAMRKNPNVLVVPCHRVIKANEEIGNYSGGGTDMKRWLLNYEKDTRNDVASP